MSNTTSNHIQLSDITADTLKSVHGYLRIESQGVLYDMKFKSQDRVYVARSPDGDYFENTKLSDLKKDLKKDSTPMVSSTVCVDGNVVGHIMNQHNWFFFRPVKSKGELDTEKHGHPDDVFSGLNIPGAELKN